MRRRGSTEYILCQPLSHWPFEIPTQLMLGISVGPATEMPKEGDAFWRWALSGREIENLKRYSKWLRFGFFDEDVQPTKRQMRAVEVISSARLAIQVVAPTGAFDSTILVTGQNGVFSTIHKPPLTSTPWGRIIAFQNRSVAEVQRAVRGVQKVFKRRIARLINPLFLLEMGLESTNLHIRTFLWLSAIDCLLMAATRVLFEKRLTNMLGQDAFVFPCLDGSVQPKYRVGELVEDLYDFRSAIAHGQVLPEKFLLDCDFLDTNDSPIEVYPKACQYRQVMEESALFLLLRMLNRVFAEDLFDTVCDTTEWKKKLSRPF